MCLALLDDKNFGVFGNLFKKKESSDATKDAATGTSLPPSPPAAIVFMCLRRASAITLQQKQVHAVPHPSPTD
jgi:hypothetical protein